MQIRHKRFSSSTGVIWNKKGCLFNGINIDLPLILLPAYRIISLEYYITVSTTKYKLFFT